MTATSFRGTREIIRPRRDSGRSDVVDDLDGVNEAGTHVARMPFHGSQRLRLMPTARTLPLLHKFSIARGKRSSSSHLSSQV